MAREQNRIDENIVEYEYNKIKRNGMGIEENRMEENGDTRERI
jgi:hypothetical protein